MATNLVRMRAILEGIKDGPVTDNFIDRTANACVYNSTDEEVQALLNDGLATKINITINRKREVFLKKQEQALRDMRSKAAANKADADAAAEKAARIAEANIE